MENRLKSINCGYHIATFLYFKSYRSDDFSSSSNKDNNIPIIQHNRKQGKENQQKLS